MNGPHDMGGQHGFGPVLNEGPDEPLFHAPWERRSLGLTLAMGATGQWNIDQSRSARESLPPATYLASSYYRIWILGLERLLRQRDLVSDAELTAGHAIDPARPVARVLRTETVAPALARGTPTARAALSPALFAVGQRVRARNLHPTEHTRLPRYVRGHVGVVTLVHGTHVFADRHAASAPGQPFDEAPTWLYCVAFAGEALWGVDAEPDSRISVDAWEPYLEAAS